MNLASILKILAVVGANVPTLISMVEQLIDVNKSSTGPTTDQLSAADSVADQSSADLDKAADAVAPDTTTTQK